jgi:hypothetical protein
MPNLVKNQLEMVVVTSRDLDGIELGVLDDGTGFLTGRGLAQVCGVAPSVVNEWANGFDANSGKPRDQALYRLLQANRFIGDSLFIKTKVNGQVVNAYPETVCMAFLEYYAFEAKPTNEKAKNNHRVLARAGLRAFIYTALGYNPKGKLADPFRSYHERLLLNKMPAGFFSCFSESAHVVLASIQLGLVVDQHTVPDISVGQFWSKFWTANSLAGKFGERITYEHVYPTDYPQSAAVRPEAYAYPVEALGEFRAWLEREYLPEKYPSYLQRKVSAGALPASRAELLIEALVPAQLGVGTDSP